MELSLWCERAYLSFGRLHWFSVSSLRASHIMQVVKNPPASAGDIRDVGLVFGSGRSPGERNGNLLQYSCLENPMDRGSWWATVHEVVESWTIKKAEC